MRQPLSSRHLINFLSFIFIFSFFTPRASSSDSLDQPSEIYKTYFPYFREDSSKSGAGSTLQILNVSAQESLIEIKFYPAADSYFTKEIKFSLKANARTDIPLKNIVFFKTGAIAISSEQEFVSQLVILPARNERESIKEQISAQILNPSSLSTLDQDGKAFELNIPTNLISADDVKIFIFNPHAEQAQIALQESLQEPKTLKELSLSSFGSGSLDISPYILEKKEGWNLNLISNQSIAAVIKKGSFPSEQFLPLNPEDQNWDVSSGQYLLPFTGGTAIADSYLSLENKESLLNNLVNLDICVQQDKDLFYKKKNVVLPPGASLKLSLKDFYLNLTDFDSLKHICLTALHQINGGLVCSAQDFGFKFPLLLPAAIEDKISPLAPVVNPLTTPTNINYQTISGLKDVDSCLWLNDEPLIPFDEQSGWQHEVILNEGENAFKFVAKDRAGNASDPVTVDIVLDSKLSSQQMTASESAQTKSLGENSTKKDIQWPDIKKPDVKPFPGVEVAPALDSVAEVIDTHTVRIKYSKDVVGADKASNYSVTPGLGSLTVSFVSGYTYQIVFQNAIQTDVTYTIVAANITDTDGRSIDPAQNSAKFTGGVYGKAVLIADLTGENAFDYFGHAIAFAGDINGDGFQDAIVGAYAHSDKDVNAGRVYVFFGIPDLGDPGATIPGPNIILDGQNDYDYFGYSVSSAGDVNGDGYTDFLVGAPYNDEKADNAGKAYLYLGGGFGKVNPIDPDPFLQFLGETKGDNFGTLVTSIGDVNADGYDDILVGAPYNDERGDNAGKAYIYFGGPAMDNQPDLVLLGARAKDYFGSSAAKAADVNADGGNDFAVGAYGNDEAAIDAGKVYVYFGGSSLDNQADKTFLGKNKGDYFGFSLASAELNGDSKSDLIVGAYGNDEAAVDAGRVYVYFGGSSFGSSANLEIAGEMAGDYFGYAISSASDLNADGKDDLLVGAFGHDGAGGKDTGRIYLFFGGSGLDNIPDLTIDGLSSGDNLGFIVSPAGFFNKDNSSEIIMGAKGTDASGQDVGKVYLYTSDFGKKKKPYIVDTNLHEGDIALHISNSTLTVQLTFNEKMNQSYHPSISLGDEPPYNTLQFECDNWTNEYTCADAFDISNLHQGFNVVKVKNAKNENNVPMEENYYYNVVYDEEKPRLDPQAVFVDANHVDIVYNEDMIYADFPQNYTITPSISIADVEHVGENLTHYRLVTSAGSRFRPNQSYAIIAKSQIQDLAHNSIDPSYNRASFTAVDNAAPVVNSFDIYDLDTGAQDYTNSLTVGVGMTDSDQDGSVVKWLLTTSPLAPAPADFTLTSRPTSYTFTDSEPGNKYLYAWVLDQSGNVSIYSAASQDSIELDAQGPDIVLDPISPNPANNPQITLTGRVEIPSWSSENYRDISVKVTGDVSGTVSFQPSPDLTFSKTIALSSGDNTKSVEVAAYDNRGNPGISAAQTVLLDTTAPFSPAIDQLSTPTNIVEQTLSGTKSLDTQEVMVKVNGIAVSGVVYPSTTTWSVLLNLTEGENKIEVTAQDLAGNVSAPSAAAIILDTQPPVIEMTYPLEGSVVNGK